MLDAAPYYECHITLTDQTKEELALLTHISKTVQTYGHWKVANFALLDGRNKQPKMFISARSDSYPKLHRYARGMLDFLKSQHLTPTRMKIEATVFDIKLGDPK